MSTFQRPLRAQSSVSAITSIAAIALVAIALVGIAGWQAAVSQDDVPPESAPPVSPEGAPVAVDPPVATGRPSGRPACQACSGTGATPCPRCRGEKTVELGCLACGGAGTHECARKGCAGGSLTCVVCKGRGRDVQRVVPVIGKPYDKTTLCEHCTGKGSVTCWRCTGGRTPCAACAGAGKGPLECPACAHSGSVRCRSCLGSGTGTLRALDEKALDGFAGVRQLAEALTAEVLSKRSIAERIRGARAMREREIDALTKHLDRVRAQSDAASAPRSTDLVARVESDLAACKPMFASLDRSFGDLDALVAGVSVMTDELASLARAVRERVADPRERENVLPSVEIAEYRARLDPVREYLDETRGQLGLFELESQNLARLTAGVRRELEDHEENARRVANDAERLQAAEAAIETELERIGSDIRDAARRAGLPEPARVDLDETRDEGALRDLHVTVLFVADTVEDPPPPADLLEPLPDWVDGVFALADAISIVDVTIAAPRLDEFGHPDPRPVQSFAFPAREFELLRTGAYRSDWRLLLSRSSPRPPLPEPTVESSPESTGGGGLLWITGVVASSIALGAAIVALRRHRAAR